MRITYDEFEIRPVEPGEAGAILEVYRQCEDFLALGPAPRASMNMVMDDLAHSREECGIYCGIYRDGGMVGVVDYVPDRFEGRPGVAFLSLLMIAAAHRRRGLGRKVVRAVEAEILKNGAIREIRSGVQVNNPDSIAFWGTMGYEITGGPERMPDRTTVYHLGKKLPAAAAGPA